MSSFSDTFTEVVETLAVSLLVYIIVYFFLAFPDIVIGASMQPTFYTGERLIVERLTPKVKQLKRGDIIIFRPPGNGGLEYIKRIVGMPGETIEIQGCKLYVTNSELERTELNEDYLAENTCTEARGTNRYEVPANSYLVFGDNRGHSDDSRVFGPIDGSRIEGKVFLRFWPLNKVKSFE